MSSLLSVTVSPQSSATNAPADQYIESHFLTHMQGVAGAYHKLIACSWVPILQVGGLGKVWVNCFPKAITTWLGWESNPRPPDPESDALTTLPRCPYLPSIFNIGRCKEDKYENVIMFSEKQANFYNVLHSFYDVQYLFSISDFFCRISWGLQSTQFVRSLHIFALPGTK